MADAIDLFLKIDGIDGESQDPKHKGELHLTSFSKGVLNAASGGGDGAGTAVWQDAVFTMRMDKAAPKLMQACVTGEHIKKAVLTFRKAGRTQQEFLKITFTDIIVSRFEVVGSKHDKDSVPVIRFAFSYAHIEEEYKAQKADGSVGGAIKYSQAVGKAAGG